MSHKHTLLLFSDTPSIPEFSKFGTTMSIWTDYNRINNTHFKSKSLNTIIGKYEDPSLNSKRFHQKCKQSWNRRWWGPSSIFQAYPVVLSDLKGKLRRGYSSHGSSSMGPAASGRVHGRRLCYIDSLKSEIKMGSPGTA